MLIGFLQTGCETKTVGRMGKEATYHEEGKQSIKKFVI